MEPKAPMDEEQRKRKGPVAPADMPGARPPPLVNNYMGPPEALTQIAEPVRPGPTGFVGFGQQLGANVEAAERMAQQAGKAALESGQVGMLGTSSGQAALLQRALGKAAEVSPLDAALAGAAGGDYFGQLQASYGPEAQARRAADMAAARAEAEAQRAFSGGMGAEDKRRRQREASEAAKREEAARQTGSAGVTNEAARLRSIDASRPRGQVTAEQWANMHGMTLEQWIQGGKKPAY